MAGLKEILGRLKSVRNTKKITYAMKLVSAAKLRKAQEAVVRSREYTDSLTKLLSELLAETGTTELSHPLMERRSSVKVVRVLIAGGGRGLCGGYNTNLNKRVDALFSELTRRSPGIKIEAVILGKKPAEYFRRLRREYLSSYEDLPEDGNRWPVDEICMAAERDFAEGKIDEVVLVYTRFKSALSMTVMAEKLLPMEAADLNLNTQKVSAPVGATLFEPSAPALWGGIVPRILRSRVRQAFLDAKASEQGSRMTAMDSATKNAGDLIDALQLKFNKLRQGRITAELLDIIGGAEAL